MLQRRAFFSFLLLAPLTGCAAAAGAAGYAVYGATMAFSGYQIYSISSGGEAAFDVEKSDPRPAALSDIRAARTLTIYPHQDGNDGARVDAMRLNTNLSVVSSTDTIPWVQGTGNATLSSIPTTEKYQTAQRLGAGHDADLVLMVELEGEEADMSIFVGNIAVIYHIRTIVNGGDGDVLWTEKHKLRVRSGATPPGRAELIKVVYLGVADRLMELRTGAKRSVG